MDLNNSGASSTWTRNGGSIVNLPMPTSYTDKPTQQTTADTASSLRFLNSVPSDMLNFSSIHLLSNNDHALISRLKTSSWSMCFTSENKPSTSISPPYIPSEVRKEQSRISKPGLWHILWITTKFDDQECTDIISVLAQRCAIVGYSRDFLRNYVGPTAYSIRNGLEKLLLTQGEVLRPWFGFFGRKRICCVVRLLS